MQNIFIVPCGIANAYIVHNTETGKSILIDCGNPGDENKILQVMQQHNIPPTTLQAVLLTHAHADHAGTAAYFKEKYHLPVVYHPADTHITQPLKGQGVLGRFIAFFSKFSKHCPVAPPDVAMVDEMPLAPYGIEGKIITLPGHTEGSVGVLLGDGSLFAGDTLMSLTRPQPAPMAQDFAARDKSIAKLSGFSIGTVYPGHGKPFAFSALA